MRDADSSQIGVRLQIDARQRLETLARLSGIPLSELVRQAVAAYVSEGHEAWRESERLRQGARRRQGGRVASVPLDVKLYGEWLLSRPADLLTLLVKLGDDLRRSPQGATAASRHAELLAASPLCGWTTEFTEPIKTSLPAAAQADLLVRQGRVVDVSAGLVNMMSASGAEELIGAPMISFLNLADPQTFDAVQGFVENDYCVLGATIAAVDARGRSTPVISSVVGTVDNGYVTRMRGVSQHVVPSDGSGTPEGMESHIPQGLWCLTFEQPVDAGKPAEEQVEAICTRARWSWCNASFAALCGLEARDALERCTLDTVFPIEEMPNRECFLRFVESGHRLVGSEAYTRTADGQLRVGRVRMSGQVVEGRLHRIYGCYEDLTHLLSEPP